MVNHVLKVRNRTAEVEPRTLTQGTAGMDTLTLDLDSEWDGLNVTVTFASSTTQVVPVITANTCVVPHEVLTEPGTVDIFILGTRDGKVLRNAAIAHPMVVRPANMSDGSTSADPTYTAYRKAYDDAVKAKSDVSDALEKFTQTTKNAQEQIDRLAQLDTSYTKQLETQQSDFDAAQQERQKQFTQAETERNAGEETRKSQETARVDAETERTKRFNQAVSDASAATDATKQAIADANAAKSSAEKAATDASDSKAACDAATAAAKAALPLGLCVNNGTICQIIKRKVG